MLLGKSTLCKCSVGQPSRVGVLFQHLHRALEWGLRSGCSGQCPAVPWGILGLGHRCLETSLQASMASGLGMLDGEKTGNFNSSYLISFYCFFFPLLMELSFKYTCMSPKLFWSNYAKLFRILSYVRLLSLLSNSNAFIYPFLLLSLLLQLNKRICITLLGTEDTVWDWKTG